MALALFFPCTGHAGFERVPEKTLPPKGLQPFFVQSLDPLQKQPVFSAPLRRRHAIAADVAMKTARVGDWSHEITNINCARKYKNR